MAYNKAWAEKKWIKWKNAEEQQLRELGVDEEIIQRLHTYDWEVFKSDRRFYEKLMDCAFEVERGYWPDMLFEELTVDSFLDSIEEEQIYQMLCSVDREMIQTLLMHLQGYSLHEIGQKVGISGNAVKKRLQRLKKKLKTIF